jgi:hypothetical protein
MSATSTCPTPTATAHFRMLSNRATRRLALSSFESFRPASEKSRAESPPRRQPARPKHLHRPRRRQRPTQSPVAESAAQIIGLAATASLLSTNTLKLFLPELEHLQNLFAKLAHPPDEKSARRSGSVVRVVQRRMPMSFAALPSISRVSGHGNDHLPVTLFEGKS